MKKKNVNVTLINKVFTLPRYSKHISFVIIIEGLVQIK